MSFTYLEKCVRVCYVLQPISLPSNLSRWFHLNSNCKLTKLGSLFAYLYAGIFKILYYFKCTDSSHLLLQLFNKQRKHLDLLVLFWTEVHNSALVQVKNQHEPLALTVSMRILQTVGK